jgi:hypothetical protein
MRTSKSFNDDRYLDYFDEDLSPVFSGTRTCVRAFHLILSYLCCCAGPLWLSILTFIGTVVARSFGDIDATSRPPYRDSGRKFNVDRLPADLRRVYDRLEDMFGEEYALTVAFTIRTAVELHRAWHMSLMTANVLQQLKEKFNLRISWSLGVIDLNFRIEDGLYELHRRVPFDYDSEFQNMYFKTAVALVEGNIGVHDALIFQKELKKGKHTCPSGLFLRNNPGRLILYPFQAATCSIIFFQGDLRDAGVSAVCGFTAGLIEWALSSKRVFSNINESKTLIDCLVGLSTGVIGGLFFKYASNGDEYCLRAVFLGTLYWYVVNCHIKVFGKTLFLRNNIP